MKALIVAVSLLLLSASVNGQNNESAIVNEMRRAGFIIVFDSEKKPVEVQIESEGDTIVCFSQKHKDSVFFTLHKWMFSSGHPSILIRCKEGELLVTPGYM